MKRYLPETFSFLAPIIVFWKLIIGGQVLYWGLPSLQFVPWRMLVNDSLRAGTLPLWTDLLGMGAPLLANHQSAVFYPPNLLSLIIEPSIAISILAVLHLSFAGVGMVRLARRVGLGDFGAAVVGITFGLSQYLTARLWFISINNAMAWLPWIILATDSLTSNSKPPTSNFQSLISTLRVQSLIPNPQSLILSALIALQLLAGHAQSSFYTLLVAAAWLGWRSLKPKQDFYRNLDDLNKAGLSNLQSLISNLSKFFLACAFALCLTAVQLIPTYELLRETPRASSADYDFVMTYSLWGWRLLTALAPDLFGHPADGSYWGYAAYWEDAIYLGIMPLMFAIYALITARRNKKTHLGDIVFLFALLIISVELALGGNTPIFPFFYRYVPGFNFFQAPARMLIGYTFAVSLLAGIGADQWKESNRKRYWSRLGVAGSFAMMILGIIGAATLTDARPLTIATSLIGVAAVSAVTFILTLNQPTAPKHWVTFTILFIAVDLGISAIRLNPTIDSSFYSLQLSENLSSRTYQYDQDEYRVKFKEYVTFKNFYSLTPQQIRDTMLPNLTILNKTESANNFDPLLTARYINFVKAMEQNPRLLDLADVQTIIKPMRIVSPRVDSKASRLRLIPQAQFVSSPQESLAAISSPTFDPDSSLILEPLRNTQYGIRITNYQLPITTYQDSYLLLSDSYYPGWRVLVDNQPSQLFIADHLFRAVFVPKGEHTITFEYAQLSFTIGLIISGMALMFWITFWLVSYKK
ncbi:MAG: YfhO family protein [Chloroflexota bacterium]